MKQASITMIAYKIMLITFLSFLTFTSSSPIPVFYSEVDFKAQRRDELDLAETDEGMILMRRGGNVGVSNLAKGKARAGHAMKKAFGTVKGAISGTGKSIKKQVNRIGSYAKGAVNHNRTGAKFVNTYGHTIYK